MSNKRNALVDDAQSIKPSNSEQNWNALKRSSDSAESTKSSSGSESGSTDQSDQSYNISLLDDVNRKIIGLLEENVFLSQTEIAKKLGLSQSSIALRLDKLRKSGILTEGAGVYLKKIGLEMCRVDANCSDPRATIEWSRSCPLFTNGSIGVGGNNVSLYFVAEDVEMFQYIIDEHIRRLKGVNEVHFSPIVTWGKDYVVPIRLDIEKNGTPPCNALPYCPRCPANPAYDGKVWDSFGK